MAFAEASSPWPRRPSAEGVQLANEPAELGGTRVISAAQVPTIREALIQIDDAEIERRYEQLDFSGTYGAAENSRSSRSLEAIVGWINDLRGFYARAVADGSAVAIRNE